ncbi:hypothetical protein QYE76_050972 [Lolium multiflorum]|uniref:Uncharacterized protein n=1 Tax=Lolium multiflorum TaxID=4521 RepID=A0AAD8WJQ4_LOLMU|nr:hypothetical protein QYE76_050972 [Lolium multiflorum]
MAISKAVCQRSVDDHVSNTWLPVTRLIPYVSWHYYCTVQSIRYLTSLVVKKLVNKFRYKSEVVKILAWDNHLMRKAEMEIKKLEKYIWFPQFYFFFGLF